VDVTFFRHNMHKFVLSCADGEQDDDLVVAEYAQADARYPGAEARANLSLRRDLGFDGVDA
jgi:hypothetical protein